MITIAADGENSILLIPGANTTVNCEYVRSHGELITGAELVLLQGEIPAVGFREAVHQATGRVVVNLAPLIEVNPQTLLEADPLLANEHEAGLILEQLGAGISSQEPTDLAQALLGAGFPSVVLTLGGAGAMVADADGSTPIATPKVSAVDTTGAGDAFAGAFVARLTAGDSLVQAAEHAARVGAFAVTGEGAQASYPEVTQTLPEVS